MKLMNTLTSFLLLGFLAVACSGTTPNQGEASIEAMDEGGKKEGKPNASVRGVITNGAGQNLYLQLLHANEIEILDTVLLDEKGEFEFEVAVDFANYYRVAIADNNLFVVILEEGDKVEATADAANLFKTYELSGSEESERLILLNQSLGKRDSVSMILQQAQMTQNQQAFEQGMAAYEPIMKEVESNLRTFIDEKPASLSSLAALQNMNIDSDFEYFKKVVDALEGKAESNEFYQGTRTQVMQLKKLAVGSEAPEIELPQPNGEMMKLSDLRGQYVLIDFWASWCGPCRRENPNVVRAYNKYHDKGFEILGVSLDKNKKAWLGAIEADGLIWKHISDLKFWQSVVVPEYQVQGIPLTYLIDPEGKIIGKNLRGAQLDKKLEEIFGE